MMKEELTEEREFPPNPFGLKRGSILIATNDYPWFGIEKGQRVPIGYNDGFICCAGLTWDIEDILGEIQRGTWQISEEEINFRQLTQSVLA